MDAQLYVKTATTVCRPFRREKQEPGRETETTI